MARVGFPPADRVDDVTAFLVLLQRAASRWNEHRLQRVQEVCARHNLGLYRSSAVAPDFKLPPTPQYAVFYYDRYMTRQTRTPSGAKALSTS